MIKQILYDRKIQRIVLFVLPFILYANTLSHGFVLDDGIVITENAYVKQGFSGIGKILSKDSFYGFFQKQGKEKLVAGGRYRPMSLIVFATAYEFFSARPFFFHLLSILVYGLLGLVMHNLLCRLLAPKFLTESVPLALMISLLFIAHPVHTECVANIKGMDETLALLFSLGSFYYFLCYVDRKDWKLIAISALLLFFGVLSKENAIVFLLLIPLATLLLYDRTPKQLVYTIIPLAISVLIFLVMRANVLGLNPFSNLSKELMNNPFIKLVGDDPVPMDISEKAGLIARCLYEYLSLMIWPHPLTHDYYPKHIPMESIGALKPLLAIVIYSASILFAIIKARSYPIFSFSIFAFVLPLFLVSNILFPVGTNMAERFLFMPSFGFLLAAVFGIYLLLRKSMTGTFYSISIIALVFGVLTILRNPAWADNYTLFTTDVKVSKNSAKIHNGIAGVLLEKAPGEKDTAALNAICNKAKAELDKALKIHPRYMEAHLQMGNIYFYKKEYENAIEKYNYLLSKLPENEDAFKNLGMAYRERGRQLGQSGQVDKAREYIKNAMSMNPNDAEAVMLMGIAEGSSGDNQKAIEYFRKASMIDPKNAQAFFNLGIAYGNLGDQLKADSMMMVAKSLDPVILKKNGRE